MMENETIKVRVTESGSTMEVTVLSKRADRIQVVIGKGVHSVTCDLTPTRNGLAYAGSVMGREIIYERPREEVQAEVTRTDSDLQRSRQQRSRRTMT